MRYLVDRLCGMVLEAPRDETDPAVVEHVAASIMGLDPVQPDQRRLEGICRLIASLSDDDGWPTCRRLNDLKEICCALKFPDERGRWLAEAMIGIMCAHVGDGPNGFRGDAKAAAANMLRNSLSPPTDGGDYTVAAPGPGA